MLRLVRACLVAAAVPALTVACGSSGKSGAPPGASGGSSGEDAGQTIDASTGKAGSDAGTVGTGGASGNTDAGQDGGSVDTTPPIFGGAKAIDTGVGEDHVVISWDPATDPPNPPDEIAYRVYRAPTPGGEDYSRAHRCGDPVADASTGDAAAVPCYLTTGTGATEAAVRGAAPNEKLYYVVRAIDAAGNEDKNTREVFGATPDNTAPDFGGIRSIDVKSATSFEVKWGAAFDLGTPAPDLTFNVYVSSSGPPDPKNPDDLAYQSKPGERSYVVTAIPDGSGKLVPLHPSTQYQVMVHAVDSSNHEDTNKRILGVTTPEGVPPTFGGLKTALAESDSSIRLFWLPGTDNDTPPASIVYDVYYSFSSGKALLATPVTTPPGASSFLVEGLEHGTGYYFVVRARDFVGNTSGNSKEVFQSTLVPDTVKPTFAGADIAVGSTPTSLNVTWSVANDDVTRTASNFRYLVYVATTAQVPLTTPVATLKGVTSTIVTGLSPGTSYNVVVLAEDEAGNVSDPPSPVSGMTLPAVGGDTGVAPTLSGTITATQVASPATKLNVSWSAATDDNYTAANIRYHVCASVVQSDCQGTSFAKHVQATTAFGATTVSLVNLSSHSSYYVYVRAEDKAGNVENADHFAQQTTATSWGQDVFPIIRDKCIACHYNGSPLHTFDRPAAFVGSLSTYSDTTGKACLVGGRDGGSDGCQLLIVDRFRPEFSYLYRKINAAGLKTPPFTNATNTYAGLREPRDSTEPLGVDEDQIILSWIAQGALGN